MKYIDDVVGSEWQGKYVLVRAGLDVPLNDAGEVSDLFRVRQAARSIQYLRQQGAKVIILSHIGRDPEETNEPVARALSHHLPVSFVHDLLGDAAKGAVAAMKSGEVLLLENLRRDPREVENDEGFARELAGLGDCYVDDAFSVAHRAHASIVGIPKFLPSYAGLLMRDEIEHLQEARTPASPSFAILGGAKFETKGPLIKLLLETYDHLFIVGALANDVFKARDYEVGTSLISKQLPSKAIATHERLIAPVDVTVEGVDKQARVKPATEVGSDEKIVDIGPDSIAKIAPLLVEAKYILWNGPTGLYESGYVAWTHATAELVAKAVAQGAKATIGGGDTIAAIAGSGVSEDRLGFLSTGGGAMLEYLLQGTLPGIDALS